MAVRLDHHRDFPSAHLQARNVDVWLPASYKTKTEKRYGVLYMHDGQNLFNPATANIGVDWGVVPALKTLTAANVVPEVIVVGIWCTDRRVAEYLPQRPFETPPGQSALNELENEIGGRPLSDAYLRFLVEELKPFIDGRYRTLESREHTTIMGSSMGGLISLYALCEYPDQFGGAGCVSTHWPITGELIKSYLTQSLPPPGHHRIYFDYGTETLDSEYEPYQKEIDKLMGAAGYQFGKDWVTHRFDGAEHSERSWRERVHIPLEFLLSR